MDHGSIGEEQGRSRGEQGREQQERERTWGTTDWENRRREESGRELATKTEPEKIREGMGDERGRSMEKAREEPARIGKGQERTWKGRGRTREVSYICNQIAQYSLSPLTCSNAFTIACFPFQC